MAETSVPYQPIAIAESHLEITDTSFLNYTVRSYYQLTLTDRPETKDVYWIAVQVENVWWGEFESKNIITDLIISDDFNREEESLYPELPYMHRYYVRLEDDLFSGESISFKIGFDEMMTNLDRIFVISADKHLDSYIKSAILQNDQQSVGDNPVFFTPINVYSNMDNGKGIFCAYSANVLEFNYNDY
jgi:hypothetical protein